MLGCMDDETRMTLRLPADLKVKLAAQAATDGMSLNSYMVWLLDTAAAGIRRKVTVEWPPIADWRPE